MGAAGGYPVSRLAARGRSAAGVCGAALYQRDPVLARLGSVLFKVTTTIDHPSNAPLSEPLGQTYEVRTLSLSESLAKVLKLVFKKMLAQVVDARSEESD